ncbi:MAG: SUMF1/EgtB/PvdO family nonheme iron enzyme [Muribaculaceae bacterium]|nr:SUMF1/EgtB/PvdO family nonheme iron enzyme [Muribaculaceae bacterium]
MILVEGDKFNIGNKQVELSDFYIAEIPVTQELYMAVMRSAHTCSHNMMPDNFDYLHPNSGIIHYGFIPSTKHTNETFEEQQKRLNSEMREKYERESKERDRILNLAKSLPVNNISWLESITFIKKLSSLTGLNFALPSFEQWYFAASGGIESKGYKYPGSDDANTVGHFHKLSKNEFHPEVYEMTGEGDISEDRKPASCWYEKPMCYQPNELGIYDMAGLVYEWLDEAGKVIGGSFNSDPDKVMRSRNYGYTSVINGTELANEYYDFNSFSTHNISRPLFGLRLILTRAEKEYIIPSAPSVVSHVSENEQKIISMITENPQFGLTRIIIANKYVKPRTMQNRLLPRDPYAFSRFEGNIYNVYLCPQNLTSFIGNCFNQFPSRRAFVKNCKDQFIQLLLLLDENGYNLLVHDSLGLDLINDSRFSVFDPNLASYDFGNRINKKLQEACSKLQFITNNNDFSRNVVFIEVRDTLNVDRFISADKEWIFTVGNSPKTILHNQITRITLNCCCNFNSTENDFAGCQYSKNFQSKGIVRFMRENILLTHTRLNTEKFDNTVRVNSLFCKQNKGGIYEYNYPESSGKYAIQDERFYVLPQLVFEEWKAMFENT